MLPSVEEAQAIILKNIHPLGRTISLPLVDSLGFLLADDVRADVDMPPFANSSMDGFAVIARDVQNVDDTHPATLAIVGTARAGHPLDTEFGPGHCCRIMTGAPVPPSADAVVPVEWTRPGQTSDTIQILKPVSPGRYLRPRGEDMKRGQVVLERGSLITAPAAGMLATVGVHQVAAAQPPRVAILSTGDELIELDQPLKPATIRNSNSYALHAAVRQAGGFPKVYPAAPDNPDSIQALFETAAAESDILVSSGGVSVGDFDFVKSTIESLGHLSLWRVSLKPGKPVVFGDVLGVPIIGLPGNPVSALVTFELFVRPVIRTMLGDLNWRRPILRLPLAQDFTAVEDRRQYVRCRLAIDDGQLVLHPHANQGSAVQTSWQDVDALMMVPENSGPYRRGDLLDALLLSIQHIS